jgi:type II secretory pathway component PulF
VTEIDMTTNQNRTANPAHPDEDRRERPPIRWGGIVWGALLVVFASLTLIVVSSPARLAAVTVWMAALSPGAAWALWIALLGLVIVVSALLGVVSAARRNRRRRSSAGPA